MKRLAYRTLRALWLVAWYAAAVAATAWMGLVIINVKVLLATSQVRDSVDAIATAVRMPIW